MPAGKKNNDAPKAKVLGKNTRTSNNAVTKSISRVTVTAFTTPLFHTIMKTQTPRRVRRTAATSLPKLFILFGLFSFFFPFFFLFRGARDLSFKGSRGARRKKKVTQGK